MKLAPVIEMQPRNPIERVSSGRLLVIAGGRDMGRTFRKPTDPRLVRAAELEIVRRKNTGAWLREERRAA